MKIHIKTTLITLTIEDDPNDAASISVAEAIKLHNAVGNVTS